MIKLKDADGYPLVPPRAMLAQMSLSAPERKVLTWLSHRAVKGVPIASRAELAMWTHLTEREVAAVLDGLDATGMLLWTRQTGSGVPRVSYMADVVLGRQDIVVYTYQAEGFARKRIMFERALDHADATGGPVPWAGDRPEGIDETIAVPEITRQVRATEQRHQGH